MVTIADQLTDLLQRMRLANDVLPFKEEAKTLLSQLEPSDRIRAEQELFTLGLTPSDLHHTCFSNMAGLFGGAAEQLKQNLPAGHVVRVMVEEHDCILSFLDNLENFNESIQQQGSVTDLDLHSLKTIALNLVGAEPHHLREEEVLFPEVEKRGLIGPPEVMRREHEQLRAWKHALLELAQTGTELPVNEFKNTLGAIAGCLVLTLRDHIMKENNILYPASLQAIQSDETWEAMQNACDRIGYCDFTPKNND